MYKRSKWYEYYNKKDLCYISTRPMYTVKGIDKTSFVVKVKSLYDLENKDQ